MRLHHGGNKVLTRPAGKDSKSSKLLNSSQLSPHFLTSTRAKEKNSKKALALPSTLALAKATPAAPAKVNDLDSQGITKDENGKMHIPDAAWRKINTAFGKLASVLLTQLVSVVPFNRGDLTDPTCVNFCLEATARIGPRDPVEIMLIAQMIGTHCNAMDILRTKPRDASRLLRAFTAQVEALRNYRRKGEQKMVIEHVTVESGGQAVVGNVVTGGPENEGGRGSNG